MERPFRLCYLVFAISALLSVASQSTTSVKRLVYMPERAFLLRGSWDSDFLTVYDFNHNVLGEIPRFSNLSKRVNIDTSSCSDITPSALSQVEGYAFVSSYFDSLAHGQNSVTILTDITWHDQEYKTQVCNSLDVVDLVPTGGQQCSSSQNITDIDVNQAVNGSISVSVQQGFETSIAHNVSTTWNIGGSVSITAAVGTPFDQVNITTTVSSNYNHTQSTTNTTTITSYTTEQFTTEVKPNQRCSINTTVTTCRVEGQAKQYMYLGGWVWAEIGPQHWGITADVIPNIDQAKFEFDLAMSATQSTQGEWKGGCENL